jgi:hypothetical protein
MHLLLHGLCTRWLRAGLLLVLPCLALYGQDKRSTLQGLVFEAEDWSTPKDAWVKDEHPPDKWCLWTREEDVQRKRSGGQSLQSPRIEADRQSPEEGAPPLHTHITGIPPGVYQVWMNSPARPIALSFDGTDWERFVPATELDLGIRRIADGTFDLWVDDRYANPGGLGSCYYDYVRFVDVQPPLLSHLTAFTLADGTTQISWLTDRPFPTGTVVYRREGDAESSVASVAKGMRNHAVVLGGLEPGAGYQAWVRVSFGPEVILQSEPLGFTAGARPTPLATQAQRIRLQVIEPTGAGRPAWPVTSGVPFRQGALASAADVRLLGADGQELPAQFEALAQWPDGSVRWLLVDFVAATAPATPAVYWLETGQGPRQTTAADVAQPQSTGWRLDTGVLRLPIVPEAGEPLAGLQATLGDAAAADVLQAATSGNAWLIDAEGRSFHAGPPDLVRVETNGPIRATLRLEGDFVAENGDRLFRYRARISAWRGLGLLRLQWTVGNNRTTETFTRLTAAGLRLPFAGAGAVSAAFDRDELAPLPAEGPFSLLQDYDDRGSRRCGERTDQGRRAEGLVTVRRGEVLLRVMVRDFWQTYPKGLAVTSDAVVLDLLPALPADQYASEADQAEMPQIMKYYGYAQGKYLVKAGLEWTSDILLEVAGNQATVSPAPVDHLQQPLVAQADPEVYCASGAFWEIDPWRPDEFPRFRTAFDTSFANLEKGRQQRGEYGWMNYGDWWGERAWNWGNSEYDLAYVTAINFAQTGRLEIFWRGEQMVRHNTTIDVVHYPWSTPFRELVYAHSVGHVGGFFSQEDPRITNRVYSMKGFIAGARDGSGGHTYQGGNFLYGFLTGDRRTLEVAESVCRNQATTYTPNWSFGIERSCGWSLYNALSAYESTLDPFYLNAARIYLEKVFELQDPDTGGWRMPQGPPECECPDAPHIGGKAFAAGMLLHGLIMVDRVLPDARVKESIVRGVDWLLDVSWNEEKEGFRYKTGCPKFANGGWYTPLVTNGIAYAYELTRNPRYREFLLRTLPKPLGRITGNGPSSGKDFASHFRHLPHALYHVKRWGVTALPLPPPAALAAVRRRVFVDAQGTGEVSVVVRNPRAEPMRCELRSEVLPEGVTAESARVAWQAPPGIHAGPRLRLRAETLPAEPLGLTLVLGEQPAQTIEVRLVRPLEPKARGTALGFVGPAGHGSLAALRQVGSEPQVIEDLGVADLSAFGALVVGSDVLGVAGLRFAESAERLAGFVQAGGRIAFLQLNDQDWPLDLLPLDLLAQDDNGKAGDIVAPEHPLFEGVPAIRPAVCYDTIAYADPGWTVLAHDDRGLPAILEAAFGRGRILIVLPSFDRWAGEKKEDVGLPEATCRQVLANLVRWCAVPIGK